MKEMRQVIINKILPKILSITEVPSYHEIFQGT